MKNKVLHSRIKDAVRPGMFFLNIGANDGKWDDPLYDYVIEKNWEGYAIEPTASAFAQLKKNLASNPRAQCINAAIIPEKEQAGEKQIFWCFSDEALSAEPALTLLSSYNRANLELYAEHAHKTEQFSHFIKTRPDIAFNLKQHITEMESPQSFTLQEFIILKNITHIDVLKIVIEGLDYAIFKKFDFDNFHPAIFIIQTAHFNESQLSDFTETMEHYGYQFRTKFKHYADVYIKNMTVASIN